MLKTAIKTKIQRQIVFFISEVLFMTIPIMRFYKKSVDDVQFILFEASPNAFLRNKQSTPTPCRYHQAPLAGSGCL